MLSKEEKKNLSKEINPEKIIKYSNKFQNITQINISSPVYLFCKSKAELNSQNENGWTPIYRSIIANNLEALYELLKLGANPNIPNNLGETPLYLSVDIDNYDALIILLQYKADCNLSKKNGNTPLHLATKRNKTSFMSALLRNNANPNIINKLYSQTPTHLAIINKIDEYSLAEFSTNKADIYNIKDKYDKTPFDYAKDVGDQNYINLLKKIFTKYPDDNKNYKNMQTWGMHTPNNENDSNCDTSPVKVNYAEKNNTNFVSLAKNVFISFDENDSNRNNVSVIIRNINEENKNNIIYNSSASIKSESQSNDIKTNSEKNKENIDLNLVSSTKRIVEPKSCDKNLNFNKTDQNNNSEKNKQSEKIKNNSAQRLKK